MNLYNNSILIFTISSVAVTFIFPFFIILFSRLSLKLKIFILSVILFLPIILILIIFKMNPSCLIKKCIQTSDDWNPNPGLYTGNITLFDNTLQISTMIDESKFKGQLIKLTCKGSKCPKNLITNCKNKNFTISKIKNLYGYKIIGNCINTISKIKNLSNSPIIENIYLIQNSNIISLQLSIKPFYNFLPLTILVPLKKM